MSKRPKLKPKLQTIPLGDLLPRVGHPYRLSGRARAAIVAQIASDGLYAPLIVRPLARPKGKFEILDGHQRADVLRELGYPCARCEVWPIDQARSDIYAVTLNHLRGRPDAKLRARQTRRLINRIGRQRVGELLALTPAAIRQQLAALDPPARPTGAGDETSRLDLRPIVFHLPAADARLLENTLRKFGDGTRRRGELLMAALRAKQPAAPRQ
jgi:ParB-like chromosome segregation protein Spo0J